MKKKKSFTGLLIILAVLFLGVGYAAITSRTLTINGNVTVTPNENDFDVVFKGAPTITDGTDPATTATNTYDSTNRTATLTVDGLEKAGDKVVVTYTIENKSNSLKATLSNLTVTNDSASGYFTVETTELNDTVLGVYSAAEATDETTLVVTITLAKTPILDTDVKNVPFTITFDAAPTAA